MTAGSVIACAIGTPLSARPAFASPNGWDVAANAAEHYKSIVFLPVNSRWTEQTFARCRVT